MSYLALDIGGTAVKSGLFTSDGILIESGETPSNGHLGSSALMEAVYQTIQAYTGYQAIGVSTAGQVDSLRGLITYANQNIPGYTGTPVKSLLEARYKVPVTVENDGIAAAIGEGAYGAGRNQTDFICLTFGTGIGSGVIENSQINRGPFENGTGELGHICLYPGGRPCACGRLGCYEQYGSAASLIRAAQSVDGKVTDGRTLFKLAAGSQAIQGVIAQWLDQVALGLAKIQEICHTKCLILGGGIFEQPALLPGLQKIFSSFAFNPEPLLRKAALGNRAGLYGAMTLAKTMCENAMPL